MRNRDLWCRARSCSPRWPWFLSAGFYGTLGASERRSRIPLPIFTLNSQGRQRGQSARLSRQVGGAVLLPEATPPPR